MKKNLDAAKLAAISGQIKRIKEGWDHVPAGLTFAELKKLQRKLRRKINGKL